MGCLEPSPDTPCTVPSGAVDEEHGTVEPVTLHTSDGLALEGELAVPGEPWAAVVLAHPHPRMGGSMRSIVISALFSALPAHGVACLRFNFRGVGESQGAYGGGEGEALDVEAGLDLLHPLVEGLPLGLAGWSFGADTSLRVGDGRHGGWFAVAPPMRDPDRLSVAAGDPRPKLLAIPQHDQFRSPESARDVVAGWVATDLRVVPGGDHFLVGRHEQVVALAVEFLKGIGA
jgi:alpha/beta superfamily hydrolase